MDMDGAVIAAEMRARVAQHLRRNFADGAEMGTAAAAVFDLCTTQWAMAMCSAADVIECLENDAGVLSRGDIVDMHTVLGGRGLLSTLALYPVLARACGMPDRCIVEDPVVRAAMVASALRSMSDVRRESFLGLFRSEQDQVARAAARVARETIAVVTQQAEARPELMGNLLRIVESLADRP